MRAGALSQRVTFQRRSETLDAFGQMSVGWVDVVTVWAQVRPLSTRERVAAMAVEATVTTEVTVRYDSRIADPQATAAMRIMHGGRILNPGPARDVDSAGRTLVFACEEGSLDGN